MRFNNTKIIGSALCLVSILLSACNGGGGGGGTPSHTVGGSVSGLTAGSFVVLQNNGGDSVIATNGSFTFSKPVADGTGSNVTLLALQFPNQTCTITGGNGTTSANFIPVAVNCVKNTIPKFAYVANTGSNDVSAYTIDASTGALTPVSCVAATGCSPAITANFAAGWGPSSVTVDPSGKFAYVANYGRSANTTVNPPITAIPGTVSAYKIDSTGALTPVGTAVAAGIHPISVTVDPTGRFAYVADINSDKIWAYTIDTSTGALTAVAGSPFVAGTAPSSVSVDPTGRFAYVANQGSNSILAYKIGSNGALTLVWTAAGTGTGAASVSVDPTGQFAYVANYASNDVSAYKIDNTGALTPIICSSGTCSSGNNFPAGTNPISVTVDPKGRFVYVANQKSYDVSAYKIETSGALTPVGTAVVVGTTMLFSVSVDPSGSFAYVTNYGDDINLSTVSAYKIEINGALTAVSGSPFPAGIGPVSVTTTIH